ncbi:hypothetical protein BV22DRAFT_1031514 [Leucogyrophana mollusca]|uniref:Uncharacterized protein n=1 Tax=Leucogyrophana mollusca TaxID=85980 RepID=A0ACB8BNX6_9AGAM|nr:hypothetical protein BV22DRAFT_1031514 [Leucogyrophana mollusca]
MRRTCLLTPPITHQQRPAAHTPSTPSVRGGSADNILALLAEFGHNVEHVLIASLR